MKYTWRYESPLGKILLACDDEGLTGLWFEGQKYFADGLLPDAMEKKTAIFDETVQWLDAYFSGKAPGHMPKLHLCGTDYRVSVWKKLLEIPYGQLKTYGDIAAELSVEDGGSSFAARAVGGAVGHNRISIIVPCHRVIGASGALTGYAGGTDRKAALLKLEGAEYALKEKHR